MNTVIFTDIASVHLSLDSVIYGLIITFLAGCVLQVAND